MISQEMTPEEVDVFLAPPRIAHLATVDATGQARVRPVWYLWRDSVLWMTTRRAARHTGRDLATNPGVAISVASEERPYRSVVIHGTPEILPKDEQTLLDISTRYGDEPGRRWVREAMAQDDRVILRLEPEKLISWDYGKPD